MNFAHLFRCQAQQPRFANLPHRPDYAKYNFTPLRYNGSKIVISNALSLGSPISMPKMSATTDSSPVARIPEQGFPIFRH